MSSLRATATARTGNLVVIGVLTAAFVTYVAAAVPIRVRPLPASLWSGPARVAVAMFGLMVVVDAFILLTVLRRHRHAAVRVAPTDQGWLPVALIPRRIHLRGAVFTALASSGLVLGAVVLGLPLWLVAFLGLLPWLPLYASEASWQYRHYGTYAFFGAIALLQLGHLGEHIAQNVQLVLTGGNVALSHGIFGQLDMEAVHFYWNVIIWLGTGLLLYRLGVRNFWLWVAFAVASLHSVEHLYLYWLYMTDHVVYLLGGSNGILAKGGLIGSPLARPYLHLLYNVLEVTPFVLAFWDQSRTVYDRRPEVPVRALAQV